MGILVLRDCRHHIEQQWTRRLLLRLLVLPLPPGLLVTRGRLLQQLLACQVGVQVVDREPWLEQHLVLLELLLVTMVVDQMRRKRRIKRGLGPRRRRRRRRREAGRQEAPPAALDQTPTEGEALSRLCLKFEPKHQHINYLVTEMSVLQLVLNCSQVVSPNDIKSC